MPKGSTGKVGVTNSGYFGIPVDGSKFSSYFWVKGDFDGKITARLVGNGSNVEYGSASFPVTSSKKNFTYVEGTIPTKKAPDGNVYYELSLDAGSVAGSSLYFGLVQLFPETYKGRENGLQPRIAKPLEELKGSFIRFPGGNNLYVFCPPDMLSATLC